MSDLKFSVITVCKNEVETIEDTILSVINQSYKNIEYIIIDGVSTDGTLDIIEKYKDKITKVISEKDNGIYYAMNKGIDLASGDLLNFMNANDSFNSLDILEKVAKTFELHPEGEILFGDYYYVISPKEKHLLSFKKNYDDYFYFNTHNFNHQSMFYKKELFEKYGKYNKNYIVSADTDKNFDLIFKKKVKTLYLNEAIANYSAGGLSCESNVNSNKILKQQQIYIKSKYHGLFRCIVYKTFHVLNYFYPNTFCRPKKKLQNVKLV